MESHRSCIDFLRLHFAVSYFEVGPRWRSSTLQLNWGSLRSDRARWIAEQIRADVDGYLWREAARDLIPRFREDDTWMADYERSREFFNYGYTFRRWTQWTDSVLPASGNILHVGGGTGMHAGVLAYMRPERRMVIAENPWGEAVGLPRLRAILPTDSVPIFLNRSLGGLRLRADFYRGILTIHSYFTLRSELQESFFAQAAEALQDRGRLVMIEPLAGSEMRHREWYLRQIAEGAEAGAPHDEFDVAFHAFIQYGAVGRAMGGGKPPPLPRFADYTAIVQRAREAGLKLVSAEESHDGVSVQYLFEKR